MLMNSQHKNAILPNTLLIHAMQANHHHHHYHCTAGPAANPPAALWIPSPATKKLAERYFPPSAANAEVSLVLLLAADG